MPVDIIDPQTKITVTGTAVDKIKQLFEDPDLNSDGIVALRTFIKGGGCSGFEYGFTFEDELNDDDTIIDCGIGLPIAIDVMSVQYLIGSIIDYQVSDWSQQFTITNPNATNTCGCGKSFSV